MTNDISLPRDYKPFPKLIICGNTLINVEIPFEIDGNIPLLIGDVETPKIWLSARAPAPEKRWHQIVRANRSLHKAAKVVGAGSHEISVTIDNASVIRLQKRSDGTPEVTELDLRPLGLNIHGDNTTLMIGTNQFDNNTFQNLRTMVAIGEGKNRPSNKSIQRTR